MNIDFFKISDDPKKVDKTLIYTGAGQTFVKHLSGSFKIDCNLMQPKLEVTYDSGLVPANYVYIQEFSKYYFITEPPTLGSQRMLFSLKEDVLQTYATGIRSLRCLIERQESKNRSNLYLPDRSFRTLEKNLVQVIPFAGHFNPAGSSFVVATGGKS